MNTNNDRIKLVLEETQPPISKEIYKWVSLKTNISLHIKYSPTARGAKSQLDAILADVNEDSKTVSEFIEKDYMINQILPEFTSFKLSDEIIGGENFNLNDLGKKKKFSKDEKRKREILDHSEDVKGK